MRRYSRLAVSASWLALTLLAPAHAGELMQLPGGDSVRAPSGYVAAAPAAPVVAATLPAAEPENSGRQDTAEAAEAIANESAEEKRARVSVKPRIGLAEDEPRETSDALARVFSSAFAARTSSDTKEAAADSKTAAVPAIAPKTETVADAQEADRWAVSPPQPVLAGKTLSLMDELALQAKAPRRASSKLDEVRQPGSVPAPQPAPQIARAEEAPLKKAEAKEAAADEAEIEETAEAHSPAPLDPVPALPVKTAEIAPAHAPAEETVSKAKEPVAEDTAVQAPARVTEAAAEPVKTSEEAGAAPALQAEAEEAAPMQEPVPAQAETPAGIAVANAEIEKREPEIRPAPKAEKAAPGWNPEDALAIAGFLKKPEEKAEPDAAEPAAPVLAQAETPAPAETPVKAESAAEESIAVETAAKDDMRAPPAVQTAEAEVATEQEPQAVAEAETDTAPVKAAAIEGAPTRLLDAAPQPKPQTPRPPALLAALSAPETATRLLNDLPPAPHSALAPAAAYEGDFTGDGNKDRLVFWRDNNSKSPYADRLPTIYAGDGHGSLQPRALIAAGQMLKVPAFVRIADFNKDGRDDILMGSGAAEGEALMLWLSGKDGRFHEATEEAVPDHAAWQDPRWQVWGMTTGDIDADGDMDVLVGTQAQMVDYLEEESIVRLFVNDGSGVFYDATDALPAQLRDPALLETGAKQLAHVSLTDMDGDEADDLRAYLPASGEHVVYLNAGFGDFTKSDPIPAHYFAKRDVAGHTGSIAALPFQTLP